VCASATAVPLETASFDVVFSDHGAFSFCDPVRIVPEAARLLRPGGRLAFCHATPLLYLTWDERRQRQTRRLQRTAFGRRLFDSGAGTVDYQVATGEWIRVMRANGLVVDDLVELRPSSTATTTYDEFVPRRWARRWPAEQIWIATKVG
jgi:SAM-dependent methyltransferase